MSLRIAAREKYIGCFVGGAIGDALGAPSEFLPRQISRAQLLFGVPPTPIQRSTHPLQKLPAGSYTDDTFLNLCQLSYFTARPPSSITPKLQVRGALARWFSECQKNRQRVKAELSLREEEVNRYASRFAGTTTLNAAKSYHLDPHRITAAAVANSCGPLVRLAPLVLFRGFADESVSIGDFYARETHTGPDSRVATSIVSCLLRFMFVRWRYSFDELEECARSSIDDIVDNHKSNQMESRQLISSCDGLRQRFDVLVESIKGGAIERVLSFGGTSHAFDVLLTALGILLITKGDFEDTAELVSHVGGDADSIGSLACSLSGLLNGVSKIADFRQAYLDRSMQPGGEEIKRIAGLFCDKSFKIHQPRLTMAVRRKTGSIRTDVSSAYRLMRDSGEGFLSHGQLMLLGKSSFLELLRRLGKREDVVISDTGSLLIGTDSLRHHPVCISAFVDRARRDCTGKKYEKKLEMLTGIISTRLSRTRDENEQWRYANILEIVGTERAVSALLKYEPIGREKSEAIRKGILLNELHRVVVDVRNPSMVPEKAFRETAFVIVRDSPVRFMRHQRVMRKDGFRHGVTNLSDIGSAGRRGGLYVIGRDCRAIGPLVFNKSSGIDFWKVQSTGFPLPASDLAIVRVCGECNGEAILVYPRRNAVAMLKGGEVVCFTRIAGRPASFSGEDLESCAKDCKGRWTEMMRMARGINPAAVYTAVSLVMEAILKGDHGCSICVLDGAGAFKGDRLPGKWFRKPIEIGAIGNGSELRAIKDYLEEDGAVVIDAAELRLLAHGQKLSPKISKASKIVKKSVMKWIEREARGMRHLFAAMYSAELKGKGLVVVGSERGDITVFGHESYVALLPSSE